MNKGWKNLMIRLLSKVGWHKIFANFDWENIKNNLLARFWNLFCLVTSFNTRSVFSDNSSWGLGISLHKDFQSSTVGLSFSIDKYWRMFENKRNLTTIDSPYVSNRKMYLLLIFLTFLFEGKLFIPYDKFRCISFMDYGTNSRVAK